MVLSKQAENTVGKGEIACFPTVFSKGLFPRGVKRCHRVGMGKIFTTQSWPNNPKDKGLENNVGEGENAGNPHFLLFPRCFLLCDREKSLFWNI